MKAIMTAILVVAGVVLFVWLIANPIADAVAMARLREMHLRLEADTDSRAVAFAAGEARPDVVAALEKVGVHVLSDAKSEGPNGRPEILITVHGYVRHEAGGPAAGDLLENVEIRLCAPPAGGRAAPSAPCTPEWWRATPLERVPPGSALPIRSQILALVADFIAEHHFPTRPAVPPNPRHLGWS
jgi:hypothetical protein